MSSITRDEPKILGDLISFDDDSRNVTSKVSEIQKLFDPLFQNRSTNQNETTVVNRNVYAKPCPPPVPIKPHFPWLLTDKHNLSDGVINSPVKDSGFQNSSTLRDQDENDDIANFLSIFISSTDKTTYLCANSQEVTTRHSIKSPKEQPVSVCQPNDRFLESAPDDAIVSGPVALRKRRTSQKAESAFLPDTQTSVELERFVETVESLRTEKQHTPTAKQSSGTGAFSFDEARRNSTDSLALVTGPTLHDNWVYNPVYGNVTSQESPDASSNGQTFMSPIESELYEGRIPSRWWHTKTGASKVAHVAPVAQKPPEVDGEAPLHWKITPRWTIPQIEVRITAHLNQRRSSSTCNRTSKVDDAYSVTNEAGIKSQTMESSGQSKGLSKMPRLRLVCDPNSTTVCELMMEALANDLLPPGVPISASDYQLRLHGRAELLHPQARLCDCHQVQLCHRLDLPLRLILEPKSRITNSTETDHAESENETQDVFSPQSFVGEPNRNSPEGEMFISYGVFQNALDKVRTSIVRNRAEVKVGSWLNEIQSVSSSLGQSVKAVLAAACQAIAFTEVLDALSNVQACIMDAIQQAGLGDQVPVWKSIPAEQWFASVRSIKKRPDLAPMNYLTIDSHGDKVGHTVSLKSAVTEQTRNKLECALHRLESNLLAQIHVFLDWRQIGLRVNPLIMTKWTPTRETSFPGQRPQALLLDSDSVGASVIKEVANSSKRKEVRSSTTCADPFVVGLIAIHRAPRFARSVAGAGTGGSVSNHARSRSVSPALNPACTGTALTAMSSFDSDDDSAFHHSLDSRFYVRLSLTYAGRLLGRICPQDCCTYGIDLPATQSGGSSRLNSSTRDTFYSDAGRVQTIRPGFPRVLQFDQWFKFPGFPINSLPRETMLAISLFSYKKGSPENGEADGTLIGWVNVPIFQANGRLKQSTVIAGLWTPTEAMHDYRPTWPQSNRSIDCPVVQLCFSQYPFEIEYPAIDLLSKPPKKSGTQQKFSRLPTEAKQAVSEAQCAILLQTLSPELSTNATSQCLTSYSAAASASNRASRQGKPHPVLPDLRLSALTAMHLSGSASGFGTAATSPGSPVSTTPSLSPGSTSSSSDTVNATFPVPSPVPIEVLWNVRPWLHDQPNGLVALLTGVTVTWPQETRGDSSIRNSAWSWDKLLRDIYSNLVQSTPPCPGLALRLLAPDVADQGIRHWAVRALALLPSEVLLLHLPQSLEAVNHDLYMDYSGLASLLLIRAATSVRFANAMYWHLNLVLQDVVSSSPGSPTASVHGVNSGVNSMASNHSLSSNTVPSVAISTANATFVTSEWRLRRFLMLKSALLWLAGCKLRSVWQKQEEAIERLYRAAIAVKQAKVNSSAREEALHSHLRALSRVLAEDHQRAMQSAPVPSPVPTPPSEPAPLLIQLDDEMHTTTNRDAKASPNPSSTATPTEPQSPSYFIAPSQPPSFYDFGLRMPYNPGLLTHRVDVHACTYFTSFTCPLRLVFHALDTGAEPIMVMFKAGDDLRLDGLISQMTFLMDRIWLDAGLDLRTIHFRIVPTGDRKGLIELVSECSTLRQIQQQGGGLTGPFKDSVITTWLQSQNTTELDYKRALDNFLRSLAGCCVMTYILGVGDRHNDNIMIRYSGHVFHVDFAKVFGNVQTFAGFKRDRVPFVLTQDMLHVLQAYSREIGEAVGSLTGFGNAPSPAAARGSGGGGGSGHTSNREGVQLFIDYCCEAYNLIRRHSYGLLSILEMGLSMAIPGVSRDSVRYVMRALKLNLSEQQASQHFTELIRKTLQSKLPALNFFVHGLAQVKQAAAGGGVSGTGPGSPSGNGSLAPAGSLSRLNEIEPSLTVDKTFANSVGAVSRTGHNNTGQLFSFNPKRFSFTQDGHIDAVVVESAVKKKHNDKHLDYYFPMYVWRKNCRVPTRVYRRIADLNELGYAVQDAFPESPVLAILPHLLNAVNGASVTSVKTQNNVQTLVDTLLEEDEKVSKSDLIYTFFHSVLFDERFAAEDAAQLNATCSQMAFWAPTPLPCEIFGASDRPGSDFTLPLLTPSVTTVGPGVDSRDLGSASAMANAPCAVESLPALQLQLCMSENMQQLDLMVKHGRALLIPGSNDLPDVYVKIYLLSGRRRKSTKRKTAIIRRSSAPSFNTTFTYELTPHDVQVGFLEISAWHSVNLGENFSLGQVYIQLRSLIPGRSITKWYPLNSDWDTV